MTVKLSTKMRRELARVARFYGVPVAEAARILLGGALTPDDETP